ncbi:MAG: PAS domain-containing protein, partial [Prochlorothrix sp.]
MSSVPPSPLDGSSQAVTATPSRPAPAAIAPSLALALDHAEDGILVVTVEGIVLYVNALGAEYFNCQPADLQGQCLWEQLPSLPQDCPIFTRTYRRALADRFPLEIQDTHLYSLQTLQVRFVPTDTALLIYCRDITLQKQTQIDLQYHTAREQLLVAIDQRIRQSLDLDEILGTAVEEIRSFLDADRVLLYQEQSSPSPDAQPFLVAQSCATWIGFAQRIG